MARFTSPAIAAKPPHYQGKPETVVTAEGEGLYERPPGLKVHIREDEGNPVCVACGAAATVWFSSKDRWEAHAERCMP